MRQRAITAVFFALAMLGGVYGGKTTFFILFLGIVAACSWEFLGLLLPVDENGRLIRRVAGTFLTLVPFVLYGRGLLFDEDGLSHALSPVLALANSRAFIGILAGTLILFLFELFMEAKQPFQNMGNALLSVFYIGIPLALLIPCSLSHDLTHYAPNRVFGLLWLVWTNDTMAYLTGSKIGKTKLFERISPKKTWEGTLGGLACTQLVAFGLSFLAPDFSRVEWLALGLVASLFGTLGDLVESMLKRSLQVKDSGNLLPGHGGMLDRFDAFIFALPFYWAVLWILG